MKIRATTILSVRTATEVVIIGDGQVTMGDRVILKGSAAKVRRIHDGSVIVGFAGATADALTLHDLLEEKLQTHGGNLLRACVELAKAWRTDRMLRRLEAMLIAANAEHTFLISGTGDVIEPEEGIAAVGSGGNYALAAARALSRQTEMDATAIATNAMEIASELCVFTNSHFTIETVEVDR